MEGSGFFRFQNGLPPTWSYNNINDANAADQEVDLTLRLGLPDENQELAPTQEVDIIPPNFSNINNINIPPNFNYNIDIPPNFNININIPPNFSNNNIDIPPNFNNNINIPPNFNNNNIDIPSFEHQGMDNSGILQNAGEGLERNRVFRKLNHKPWPLPVLNMLSNNLNSISGNSVQQQQQQRCKICEKTDTPLWRKGPDGPKTLCNGCGLRYAREIKRQ